MTVSKQAVFCGVVLSLALIFDMPAMAQDKAPFQGNWLGWGCFGKGAPIAVSFSVDGDSTTFNHMIDQSGYFTYESTVPASYRVSNGVTTVLSSHNSIKFVLQVSSDDSNRLDGTMEDISLMFSHGPDRDLRAFADAYAPFCDQFDE